MTAIWAWIVLLLVQTQAVATATSSPTLFNAPICRYSTLPCTRLVDRNWTDIVAPSQFMRYAAMLPNNQCPTNYSTCVRTNVYSPMLSRINNGVVNMTITLLENDLYPLDAPERFLTMNLMSTTFLNGPPCITNSCNETSWSFPIKGNTYNFLVKNAIGIVDLYLVSKTSRVHLSSMSLQDIPVTSPSNAQFSPTISLENDPVRMRMSFLLPMGISNTSVCVSIVSSICPSESSLSFHSLEHNSTIVVLQGSSSIRTTIFNVERASFCLNFTWDATEIGPLLQPLGIAFPGVYISNSTKLPSSIEWTAMGTPAQCAPLVTLSSPRAIDKNPMEPKTLWTVISLVLYVFAFVIACLLVRLHGLSFVRETMYTDLALLSIILLLLSSLLIHVIWLTILNRLPGAAIETGFLVAILDGLRQAVGWALLVSICTHWFAIVYPNMRQHHGKFLVVWIFALLIYLVLLLLHLAQNYGVMKCTYVDYLRNGRGGMDVLWLPLLQPGEWKYGVDKVCGDYPRGFLYTYGAMHLLPLGSLVLFASLGIRLLRQGSRGLDTYHSVVQWAICSLCFVVLSMSIVLGLQHSLSLYFYSREQRISPVLWLVLGEYLPTLVPSIGFLLLQWNSKLFTLPTHARTTSAAPSTHWSKPLIDPSIEEQQGLLSPTYVNAQRMAELTMVVQTTMKASIHPMSIQIYQSMEEEDAWTLLHTTATEIDISNVISIQWQSNSRVRIVVADQSIRGSISATDYYFPCSELLHSPQRIQTSQGSIISLSLSLCMSKKLTLNGGECEVTEHLRESVWPTQVVIAFLSLICKERLQLYEQAVQDLEVFEANLPTHTSYANIIDQIQGESDIELVRQWLRQRITKRFDYHELIQKCIILYKERLREGLFLKKSTEKKESNLRFLPINFHVHEMEVNGNCFWTITQGAFACHSNQTFYHQPDDITSPINSFLDERMRYRDEVEWSTLIRHDESNAQALASLVTCVIEQVNFAIENRSLKSTWQSYEKYGFLFQVESLLSDHGKESQMLYDCSLAIEWLRSIKFELQFTSDALSVHNVQSVEKIELSKSSNGFLVSLVLPSTLSFDSKCISVLSLLFTQGINEMQTLANKATMYKETLPDTINEKNGQLLAHYIGQNEEWLQMDDIQPKLTQLQQVIVQAKRERVKKKHPEILQLAGQLSRLIGGGRVSCCKSGKDRTAMSVTLEHGWILGHYHYLGQSSIRRAVATMRSDGVRLDCVEKNIGKRQYAFNALQRSMLPEAYRCPDGTYGNGNLS